MAVFFEKCREFAIDQSLAFQGRMVMLAWLGARKECGYVFGGSAGERGDNQPMIDSHLPRCNAFGRLYTCKQPGAAVPVFNETADLL